MLFTDGWSNSGQYDDLLKRMAAAGITLSTVGTGGGNADDFLGDLAKQGGGRYYPATDPTTIPDIFLKETQQVSGQQIVEEQFFPAQTSQSPILDEISGGLPQLLGYNGTTPSRPPRPCSCPTATIPSSPSGSTAWVAAVAWTSDATGPLGVELGRLDGFNRFFSQLVRWTFPGDESGGMEAEFVTDGDQTKLRLRSVETDGTPRNFYDTTVNITDPAFDTKQDVRLDQVAPGVYETRPGHADAGRLRAALHAEQAGRRRRWPDGCADRADAGRVPPAGHERAAAVRPAQRDRWRATSRPARTPGRTTWARPRRRSTCWPWLLLLALLLWPIDVAVRRVSLSRGDVGLAREWVGVRWARWRGPARRPEQVGGMLAAKDRAGGRQARAALVQSAKMTEVPPIVTAPTPPVKSARALETAALPDAPTETAPATPAAAAEADTLARLREAKRRARR